ncbi:MAG TPA: hypothetical protein VGR28_06880, partial [Candidatus Thermoplasmatota archaeon]|nr:hypothetical protein [Candidatus Thermoplasmatota archaeon]
MNKLIIAGALIVGSVAVALPASAECNSGPAPDSGFYSICLLEYNAGEFSDLTCQWGYTYTNSYSNNQLVDFFHYGTSGYQAAGVNQYASDYQFDYCDGSYSYDSTYGSTNIYGYTSGPAGYLGANVYQYDSSYGYCYFGTCYGPFAYDATGVSAYGGSGPAYFGAYYNQYDYGAGCFEGGALYGSAGFLPLP